MIATPTYCDMTTIESPGPHRTIAIPLALDRRQPHDDGYVLYVGHTQTEHSRAVPAVLEALACAIATHLETLPPFEVK